MKFLDYWSERLKILVLAADKAPHPPPESHQTVEAGLSVIVFMCGDVEVTVGETTEAPRANGMLVSAVREASPWSGSGQANRMRAVGVNIYRDGLRERGLEAWFDGLFVGNGPVRAVQAAADPRSLRMAERMLTYDAANPLDVLKIEAAAQEILVRGIALLDEEKKPVRDNQLLHLVESLEADLGHAWTATKMARLSGMSERSLSERFKQEFGNTPFDWLRQRRLLRGRDMLIQDQCAVYRVADQLGFCSPAHFSSAYRKMFGETPKDARRIARQAKMHNSAGK